MGPARALDTASIAREDRSRGEPGAMNGSRNEAEAGWRHPLNDPRFPWIVAGLVSVLELAPAGNYGISGDELYFSACSEHLDFGYVDHPPLVAVLTWISRAVFGESLRGLRLLPALAGAATVVLASATTRRLGGGPWASGLAALATACTAIFLALCNTMSMNAFDILLVTASAHVLVGVLDRPSPCGWLLLGRSPASACSTSSPCSCSGSRPSRASCSRTRGRSPLAGPGRRARSRSSSSCPT